MGTDIVTIYQCHGAKYSRMAVEIELLVHGHHGYYERSGYKNTFGHCRQVVYLTGVEGQLGVWELVSCCGALHGDLESVPCAWIFLICKEGPYQDRPPLCPFRLLPLLIYSGSTIAFLKFRGPRS